MCNKRSDANPNLDGAPRDPAAAPEPAGRPDLRTRYDEFLKESEFKDRLKLMAVKYWRKQDVRRHRGGVDAHEDFRDFINEGLARLFEAAPDVTTVAEFVKEFGKKLDNRDRAERRSSKSEAVRVEAVEERIANDDNVVPWRTIDSRPDLEAERLGTIKLVKAKLARRAPALVALFDLYLSEGWSAALQARVLCVKPVEIHQMRRRLNRHLEQIAQELHEGDD